MFRYSKIQLLNEYGEIVVCCDWHLEFNRASNDNKMLYVQNANNSSLSF